MLAFGRTLIYIVEIEIEIERYHIISYHIISYHIISYHIITSHHITSRITSHHISRQITYHITSRHVTSHHINTKSHQSTQIQLTSKSSAPHAQLRFSPVSK